MSSYDYRVLADEELYMVIGGTGSLESEGASLQGVNTASSLGENGLAERLNETVSAYIQENDNAQSGSYMAGGDDSSSSDEALQAAKVQAIKDMIANRGTHLSIADLRSKASKAPQLAANYSNVGSIDNHGDHGQSYQENNTNYQPDNDANDSTASVDIGPQSNQAVEVSIEDLRDAALAAIFLQLLRMLRLQKQLTVMRIWLKK